MADDHAPLAFAWAPARYFAVGLAWGAPFLFLSCVTTARGIAVHPHLAHLLSPLCWPLVLSSPVFAILGIALVVSPSRPRSGVATGSLLSLPVLVVLLGAVFLALGGLDGYVALIGACTVAGLLVLAGLAVSARALWHRQRWLALAFLAIWSVLLLAFVLASSRTDADWGTGPPAILMLAALWLGFVSLVAGILAFLVKRTAGTVAQPPVSVASQRGR